MYFLKFQYPESRDFRKISVFIKGKEKKCTPKSYVCGKKAWRYEQSVA